MKLILKTLICVVLIGTSALAQAATLTSSVNRNPIKLNETLTLTIQYSELAPSSTLDLSGLNQDFEILANAPTTNSSVSIINGQTSRETTTTWVITLAAKGEGELTIPAFEVNGDRSNPIKIQVNGLTAEELAQPRPINVSVTIDDTDNLNIKPGEQIIVEVELSAATNVGNIRGQELIIAGAELVPLGQQDGQRQENGVLRQVAIWRYALFPETSGEITVPAQTFNGSIGGRRTSFFDSFSRGGEPVGARSVEQSIVVDARPETNGNAWFPANNVTVESAWASSTDQIRVGEPITRTITITADGQRASAIPPLTTSASTNFKSYQDQPQIFDTNSNDGIVGVRRESAAIVPSTEGTFTLPEQRIAWWDNKADAWREAVLPQQIFNVMPAANADNNTPPQVMVNSSENFVTQSSPNATLKTQVSNNWLWKLTTLCLALLCLGQFVLLNRRTNPKKTELQRSTHQSESEANAWQRLQQALKGSEVNEIRQSLLDWSSITLLDQVTPNLQTIARLSESDTLKQQLANLEQQLYNDKQNLDINELSSALNQFRDQIKSHYADNSIRDNELAPLYPV